ncbi:MAG: hypothetical protein QOJ93_1985, partial [Actinomycetota bacterium]|nr:hypothetical protein [Actinomycetota bacterium]
CQGIWIRLGATLGAGSAVFDRTGGLVGVALLLGDMGGASLPFQSSALAPVSALACVSA